MPTIKFSVSGVGTLDNDDRRAAVQAIKGYNFRKEAALPFDTAANIRASYLTVLTNHLDETHLATVGASKTQDAAIAAGITPDQQAELNGAIVDRLQAGDSFQTILTDLKK